MRLAAKYTVVVSTMTAGLLAAACAVDDDMPTDVDSVDVGDEKISIDTSATYTIVGVQSGKCVEVAGGSTASGANLQIFTCNGVTQQQFRAEAMDSGFYRIRNVKSNLCLDVSGASTADGARLVQSTCGTGGSQQWSFTDVAIGVERITNRGSGKAIDVMGLATTDGTGLQQWASSNGENQKFKVQVVSGGTGTGGAGGGTGGSGGAGGGTPSGKFVGNITTSGQIEANFLKYWNQITPENEGKWDAVEPQRDIMNWSKLDAIYKYTQDHNIPFKGHTFVWGSQQPSWLSGLSQADQRAEIEELIQQFCQRYPKVALIDVVNEPPPHTQAATITALGGAGQSGYDWIVNSFKLADKYCPNAVLILNDYNTIEYGNDNTNIINIANKVKAAGAPIDAIGAQAHDAFKLPVATVKGFIDKIASQTGLPVYITEYDIDLADDNKQKQVMQEQFTMFWNNPNVKGITLWGYIQGATWKPNTGLVRNGQPRPAMTWLMSFLGR